MRLLRHSWAVLVLGLLVLAVSGCPQGTGGSSDRSSTAVAVGQAEGVASEVQDYPIPRGDRPYQDIHPAAKNAWLLVETTYFVVIDNYNTAAQKLSDPDPAVREEGSRLRRSVGDDVQSKIFTVNEKIEEGFLQAIEEEPDNPLNYATYAFYLKPRKRVTESGGTVDTEPEALEMVDKAIELWPDEAAFYLLKIHILAEPHRCHEWLRSQAMEGVVISERLPLIRELFSKAEKYDPANNWINYYHALLVAHFTPEGEFASVRDEVLREIKAGNRKRYGNFCFPPPLPPYPYTVRVVRLVGGEIEPQYIDQWTFFGHYDWPTISITIDNLVATMDWPEDKADVGELMFFLYRIGRTLPFDRSAFSLQLEVLSPLLAEQEPGSEEALKLAEALRYLDTQYRSVAEDLLERGVITEPTRIGVRGINELEKSGSRRNNVGKAVQGPQANYLKKAGEILGLEFDLPLNPALW